MAKLEPGRAIVTDILNTGDLSTWLDLGWDREWLHDRRPTADGAIGESAMVFSADMFDAYDSILRHWEKYGEVPSIDVFRKNSPTFRLNTVEATREYIRDEAIDAVAGFIVADAANEMQRYVEGGDPFGGVKIMQAATKRAESIGKGKNRIRAVSADSYKIKNRKWLWEGRILCGAATVTGGKPGIGKSQFMSWLTAQVTLGGLEGEFYGAPRSVIYVCSEDDRDSEVIPRLLAAGADLSKVQFLEDVAKPGRNYVMNLKRDLAAVEQLIKELEAVLVIFDPYTAVTVKAGARQNDNDDIRSALLDLVETAQATGCAIHGLMHVNKDAKNADDMLSMLSGANAWGAVFRGALMLARTEDMETDDPITVVTMAKSNSGKLLDTNPAFKITGTGVLQDGKKIDQEEAKLRAQAGEEGVAESSYIEWLEEDSDFTAMDVMKREATFKNKSRIDKCVEWLEYALSDGPRKKIDLLEQDAMEENFGPANIGRAKQRIGIVSDSVGFGKKKCALWSLPEGYEPTYLIDKNAA